MAEVWRDMQDGTVEYVPTKDGAFERWMGKFDPDWMRVANSAQIEFLARAVGSGSGNRGLEYCAHGR